MNKITLLVSCCLGFGGLFAAASLLFSFGEWRQLFLLLIMGMCIGALAAPVFVPKEFEKPLYLQTISGTLAGFFGFLAATSNVQSALLGAVLGAVVGATAPIWSKQIEMP